MMFMSSEEIKIAKSQFRSKQMAAHDVGSFGAHLCLKTLYQNREG